MIEAQKESYESQVLMVSNYIADCHHELELIKNRVTSSLRQERDMRLGEIKTLDLTQNGDTFDKYTATDTVEVVIDEKIFDYIKTCVKIKLHEPVVKKPELMSSISVGNVVNVISDADIDSEEA